MIGTKSLGIHRKIILLGKKSYWLLGIQSEDTTIRKISEDRAVMIYNLKNI
jgi:hypothetical protein